MTGIARNILIRQYVEMFDAGIDVYCETYDYLHDARLCLRYRSHIEAAMRDLEKMGVRFVSIPKAGNRRAYRMVR